MSAASGGTASTKTSTSGLPPHTHPPPIQTHTDTHIPSQQAYTAMHPSKSRHDVRSPSPSPSPRSPRSPFHQAAHAPHAPGSPPRAPGAAQGGMCVSGPQWGLDGSLTMRGWMVEQTVYVAGGSGEASSSQGACVHVYARTCVCVCACACVCVCVCARALVSKQGISQRLPSYT